MRIKGLNNIFEGQTVSIVGGGPSLEGFDFSRLQHPIFSVNNSVYFIGDPDLFIALDDRFYRLHAERLSQITCPKLNGRNLPGVNIIHYEKQYELDLSCRQANLSGLTAVLVALTLGAEKIFLFGFDGGFAGTESNYYPNDSGQLISWRYEMQNSRYGLFEDQNIINVGMDSRIDAFPKVDLHGDFYAEGHRIKGTEEVRA
jgi:hypothetical protein